MEVKKYESEYPKEALEVGEALKKLLSETAKALSDGWDTGSDLPIILTSSLGEFAKAMDGVKGLVEEGKVDPIGVAMGVVAPVGDGARMLYQTLKPEA